VGGLGSLLYGSGSSRSPGQGLCCTHKVLSLEKSGWCPLFMLDPGCWSMSGLEVLSWKFGSSSEVLVSNSGVMERLVMGVKHAVET